MESVYDGVNLQLDEIRLLELQPAEQTSDQLCCRLSTVVLSNPPAYEALSYVWGDANEKIPIVVNDRSFGVTTNLSAGLRRIRRQDVSVLLWVDAICINQQDIPERNRQVQLMRQIYMQAEQALLWLGESNEDSELAMDLIRRWSPPLAPQISRSTSRGVAEVLKLVCDPFEVRAWEALRSFFQRPYWERSWILQEVILSKRATLICGSQTVSWQALDDAQLTWVQLSEPENFLLLDFGGLRLVTLSNYNIASKISVRRLQRKTDAPLASALEFVEYTQSSKATDPRDKIYAFLGFEEFSILGLEPDYEKPVEKVYGEFFKACVRKERRLDILNHAGIGWPAIEPVLDLPSWVPDFRAPGHRSPPLPKFCAGRNVVPVVDISEDFRVLTARGVIYDTIKVIDYHDEDSKVVKTTWQDLALGQPGLHPTGIPYLQAYFRTVVADNSGYGYGPQPFRDAESERRFFDEAAGMMWWLGKWALDNDEVHSGLMDRIKPEDATTMLEMNDYIQNFMLWSGYIPEVMTKQALLAPFLGESGSISEIGLPEDDNLNRGRQCSAVFPNRIAFSCTGRSFFVSGKGYLGLAPKAAKIGDFVCVQLGCDKPLIIRREGDHYLLIGDSYVYGIMNGEVMQDVLKGYEKLEDILFH